MQKKLRIAAVVGCTALAVLAVGVFLLLKALQYEPDFYRRAVAADPADQRRASDEMLRQASGLCSAVQKDGRWEVLFTAEQINGWLAVDLVENHPQALPKTLRDPRVAIEPDRVTLACRFEQGNLCGVVSLIVEPYVPEPNVLGLRICQARAGLLPWPLTKITEGISEAAGRSELRLQWRQAHGDPVALISIPAVQDEDGKLVQIESLRIGQGEIYLSGTTRQRLPAR